MKACKTPKCLYCKTPFKADARNAGRQKYCNEPACRKASKKASTVAWLSKPENIKYHSGPEAVTRVQEWQKAHPEYRTQQKAKRQSALQDASISEVIDFKQESEPAPAGKSPPETPEPPALQDFVMTQHLVFIGLIAHFFDFTLQDDIDTITRFLQKLGEDIIAGRKPNDTTKTDNLPGAGSIGASPV